MHARRASRRVSIQNAEGLHLRPAAILAKLAAQFHSEIRVQKEDRVANAKSIWDLLSLVAAQGESLTLEANGPDSQAAVDALAEIILGKRTI